MFFCVESSPKLVVIPVPNYFLRKKGLLDSQPRNGVLRVPFPLGAALLMENIETTGNYKICCITGHRPKGFPWNYYNTDDIQQQRYISALRDCLIELIEKYGYNYFITGCAVGADLDFAEICIELRDNKYPNIQIEGAIPCDNQNLKWSIADKERYARVIEKLNTLHYVSHDFSMACFQKRNVYMVDRSELVIAVWNAEEKGGTWNTIKYARKNKKTIRYIYLV